ncbi:S8 family serine peptidase [Micromonospora sp. RL09-050-HVF-A]|uniref:S8 family serine peptidase n=1 Tax=Micromonospora sp. RL09-050-HVF-A TaxID=1703433 RepID=UPI001C5D7017|nr:S8 family serine peptidase [Micromonospora sp. RL09-050-HVF-A]
MRKAFTITITSLICIISIPTSTAIAGTPRPDGSERVRNDQWHLDYLNVKAAHAVARGKGVVVAVPDTGVDPHVDLRRNLLPGSDMIPGGRGDGQEDRNSHGTCMAGLIAAHGRPNRIGALGVAPEAKILPIFDTPPSGMGNPDDLAASIDFAARSGADIISISAASSPTKELQQAISSAQNADILIVAGVGNAPRESRASYPASTEGVLAVGGIDRNGRHLPVSVTGPEVDLVAPAIDIYCPSLGGRYRKSTGTSDATAIVAGAAALVRSKYPYLPAAEVVHRLTATAVDKGPPGRDDEYGYGVIDLVAALTADVPPLGFESVTAAPPQAGTTSAATSSSGGNDDGGAAARGWATLGVIVAAGCGFLVWRRRRRADDPPPRISR